MGIFAQSGGAGAALWKRNFGENMEKMVTRFPYWLCRNAWKFVRNEDDLLWISTCCWPAPRRVRSMSTAALTTRGRIPATDNFPRITPTKSIACSERTGGLGSLTTGR